MHKPDPETTSERLLWGVHSETCQIVESSQISAQLLITVGYCSMFWVGLGSTY